MRRACVEGDGSIARSSPPGAPDSANWVLRRMGRLKRRSRQLCIPTWVMPRSDGAPHCPPTQSSELLLPAATRASTHRSQPSSRRYRTQVCVVDQLLERSASERQRNGTTTVGQQRGGCWPSFCASARRHRASKMTPPARTSSSTREQPGSPMTLFDALLGQEGQGSKANESVALFKRQLEESRISAMLR